MTMDSSLPPLATLLFSSLALLLFSSPARGLLNPKCEDTPDDTTTNLRLFHVHSPCSPLRPKEAAAAASSSWEESVLEMQSRDEARLEYLESLQVAGKSVVPIASGRQMLQSPTYVVRVKIGTPPQTLLMAMDTSNDAAWVPCSGCLGCPSALFATNKSTTFRPLTCNAPQCNQVRNPTCHRRGACTFNTTYGSSTVAANLSRDTLRLAADPIRGYTFGCIQKTTGRSVPPQGLLGLGRGPLSLLSQSQNLYKSTFSYCLPSFKSGTFSGSLRLGPAGQPMRIKYTQLLRNPMRSSLYYVRLIGIKVGGRVVNVPPSALAFNATTGAGTIFDSGTVFTRLVEPAYVAVRNEFRKQVGHEFRRRVGAKANLTVSSLGGFDTCYSVPIVAPAITMMFSGMNVTLGADNLLIHSTAGSVTCLAMAASPPRDNINSVLNVIASMQQQNHRVLFDVPNSRLGVARQLCS